MNIYEYMHGLQVDDISRGVDALTITSTGLDGKLSIDLVKYALRDYCEVNKPKPFSFQGARGQVWGSVRYAAKWDDRMKQQWAILMVTGKEAELAIKESLAVKDVKYTRVDLFIDIKLRERALGLPRKLYDTYKGDASKKLIESLTGDTLYIGSRQSESMVRIYDKSPEYGYELGNVWRWEVEFKRGLAGVVARTLETEGEGVIADLVWCEARDKHLPTPVIPDKVNVVAREITLSSSELKLQWLRRQVAPTVDFLKRLGYGEEVKEVLQLGMW